jgi:hypothetical protein
MSFRALWLGLLGGPIVWFVFLQLNYVLATSLCTRIDKSILGIVAAAAIVLTIAVAATAWRSWRMFGSSAVTDGPGIIGRSRFLALTGLGMSAFFILVLIANTIPIFILQPCE